MFFVQISKQLSTIWLGADLITNKTFQWSSDLSTVNFANWDTGNDYFNFKINYKKGRVVQYNKTIVDNFLGFFSTHLCSTSISLGDPIEEKLSTSKINYGMRW